ncbi:MAG: NADH:flavin oxidoreductase, partial [Hyphomonas sp.]|nr:NADH:flavin oxidoreductase [Hyphomonas sp.]
NGFGAIGWYYEQLRRLGAGDAPNPKLGLFTAFLANQKNEKRTESARKAATP